MGPFVIIYWSCNTIIYQLVIMALFRSPNKPDVICRLLCFFLGSVSHHLVYLRVCKDARKDVEMQRNRTCIPGLNPQQVYTNMLHVVGMISL